MLPLKMALAVNTAITVVGEWRGSSHWLPIFSMYAAFVCFVLLALAFTMQTSEDYAYPKTKDGPP